jgi:hypothetical protein
VCLNPCQLLSPQLRDAYAQYACPVIVCCAGGLVPVPLHTHTHQHTRLTAPLWGVFTLIVPHFHCQCFLNRPLLSFSEYVSDPFLFHTTQSAGCSKCNINRDSFSPEIFLASITLRASKLSHTCYMPVRLIILHLIFQMFCEKYKIIKIFLSLRPEYPPPPPASALFTDSLSLCCSLEVPHLHRSTFDLMVFYALIVTA